MRFSTKRRSTWLAAMLCMLACGAVCLGAEPDQIAAGDAGFSRSVAPFVEGYCIDCHNETEANGGFDVEAYSDVDAL
ncbi:MAG: hypothetical protein KC549_05555 [Myxococcales bacterium]|nr:hypothetical protein [Myxococcales bacterium]